MRVLLPLLCLTACAPTGPAVVHTRDDAVHTEVEPLPSDTAAGTEVSEIAVDDQEFVITEIDEGDPRHSWFIDIGPQRYVTFRMAGPVELLWQVIAPDALPLDIYDVGIDQVTHGKTGPTGGTFELIVELPPGATAADVALSIQSDPL